MAVVQMKCPNCGGTMGLVNNQFICSNCRTMMLNIVDAKIDADVTVMSPDEFARKIEESKRQFIVNINDNLKVFDVNTMVINKQIQDATSSLARGEFDQVMASLSSVPSDILSAERLRYLAEFRVKNEYELSFHDGYIDENPHFKNIIRLADDQTRATYQKIAYYCREQYDTKRRIEAEITEVNKLLDVKLYQEAIAYTKEMCKKYPQTALSWAYACEVKCTISSNYNGNLEFSMMEKCPDYSESKLPMVLREKINKFSNLSKNYESEYKDHVAHLGYLAGCMWATVLSLILYAFIGSKSGNDGSMILLGVAIYVVSLGSFIATIVNIVQCIKIGKRVKQLRKQYNAAVNLIPNKIKKQYCANCASSKKGGYIFAIVFWFIAVAVSVYIIVNFTDIF